MAIRNYKPTTNARRGMSTLVNDEITTNKPEKSLLVSLNKNGGRNNQGRITVRHHGGGAKRKYRISSSGTSRAVLGCKRIFSKTNCTPSSAVLIFEV